MEKAKIKLLGLLPCGLRNAFKFDLQHHFSFLTEENGYVIDGNLNYEKEFYDRIEGGEGMNEIPDIFISSDINSLYHQGFLKRYLNKDCFEKSGMVPSDYFLKMGYNHPDNILTMLPGNMLVIVANTEKYLEKDFPHSFRDLFRPGQKLILRGDEDFFCNALFLPLIRDYGFNAVKSLAKNCFTGLHPANMVKMINSGNANEISAFVMPYTFYLKIRNPYNFKIVWPSEGAILSPVQMLVKKGKYAKYKEVIDYITYGKFSDSLLPTGFFPVNKDTFVPLPGNLNWIGWEYVYNHDIKIIKEKAQRVFFDNYNIKSF